MRPTPSTASFIVPLALSLALVAPAAEAGGLLVCEATHRRVMLFDSTDGTLLDERFVELGWLGAQTPIEALVVADELWITDEDADAIFRFALDGQTYLGTLDGASVGFDDVRGATVANGRVYVANGGTLHGAPGEALVVLGFDGVKLASIPVGDPWDALAFDGRVLTTNGSDDQLQLVSYDGTFVLTLHESDGVGGIDAPRQAALLPAGDLVVAGSDAPDGLFEYDGFGHELARWDTATIGGAGAPRGVARLGDGRYLFTNAQGVHILDPTGPSVTTVAAGVDAWYVGVLGTIEPGHAFCFGDGGGAPCPCGNLGGPGAGCANSTGAGAVLAAQGSVSVAADDLILQARDLPPGQPGLFLQGTNAVAGGSGIGFGDGLRCAGGSLVRLQVVPAGPLGTARTTLPLAQAGGVLPGDTRRYQLWYRDPAGSPCGVGFNLTNGYEIVWGP